MIDPTQMSDEDLDAYVEGLRAMARSQIREDAIFPLANLLREHAFGPDYHVTAQYPRRFVFGSQDAPLLIDFEPGEQEPVSFVIHHQGRIVMSGVLTPDGSHGGPGIYYGDGSNVRISQWDRGAWEDLMWKGVELVQILSEKSGNTEA